MAQTDRTTIQLAGGLSARRSPARSSWLSALLALAGCGDELPRDHASATIGVGGGEIRLDGFILTIPTIPDNTALLEPMTITVTRTAEPPPAEYDAHSAVYQVEPFDFEVPRFQARVAIRVDGAEDITQAELMWTAADSLSYEPRPGLRGPDFLSAAGWRFGRMFVGARRACTSPRLSAEFVATDPTAAVRGFGWSFSLDGLRQRLVVAEEVAGGYLQVEQFDANTLAFIRRTTTDVVLSPSVQPVVDRYEAAVYAGTSDGGVAIVGIDAGGTAYVERFPSRGQLLRLEARAYSSVTEVDVLARDVAPTARLVADQLLIEFRDGVAQLGFDGYIPRSVELTAPVLDIHASIDACFYSMKSALARYPDGSAELFQLQSAFTFPQLSRYGPLGTDGVGAIAATVTTETIEKSFEVEFDTFHSASAMARWLVPRNAAPPLITASSNDPAVELPLPGGGILATADLDGDLLTEILRIDGTGTIQFVNTTTGAVGQLDQPPAGGSLRLDLGVRSAIDHDADLCARPRAMPTRPGFAMATNSPAGLVVYSPSCSGQ